MGSSNIKEAVILGVGLGIGFAIASLLLGTVRKL